MSSLVKARGLSPQVGQDVFIADNSRIIGDTAIGDRSSVWFNVTIRGDVMPIRIGKEVNIQDGSVLHGTYGKYGCTLEDRVTIGHQVTLHGCTIGACSLIGMGSIVMDNAKIGSHSLVGAGSLVTENSHFPPRSLILGRPAQVKRELTQEEVELLEKSADNYLQYKKWYE